MAAVMPTTYDVDIVEVHHRHKEDAPSGTALALAQAISETSAHHQVHGTPLTWGLATSPRPEGHIDMHAMRISHIPCQHQVMWTSAMEQLTISHTVFSREALIKGAVDLMVWLLSTQRSSGLYHVEDRWGLPHPVH
jgi:4-hydroxy-tetrahydrodipicolinate reductase